MSGLILIAVLWIWFLIAKNLSTFFTQQMQFGVFKKIVQVLLFALILVAPVADEIIGGFQFRALCKAEAVAIYDKDKVYGKSVYLKSYEKRHLIANTILPTYKSLSRYADNNINTELISFVEFHSDGGWLSRWINFNSVHRPYTFDGSCSGGNYLFENLNIKSVNKEDKK